ncbi:MAG: hypothetical protein M3432_00355 [Chloroflexota bacterium]|nr:hypothetical protein [Chloroflexota bacterium]
MNRRIRVLTSLRSGIPLQGSPACRRDAYLYARVGDVIAVAFDGRLPGVPNLTTTAAWIEGRPHGSLVPGPERLTIEEVRRLASLPDTATAATGSQTPTAPQAPAGYLVLSRRCSLRVR